METFIILALVVTVLYVCYYAVVIAVDLHGARESGKPTVEEFSVSADKGEKHSKKEEAKEETGDDDNADEGGVIVSESNDGFILGTSILTEVDVSQLKQSEEPAQIKDELATPVIQPVVKPQVPQRPAYDIPIEGEDEEEDDEDEKEATLQQHLSQIEAGMDDVHPAYQDKYTSEEFVRLMQNGEAEQKEIRVRMYDGEHSVQAADKL